MGQFQPEKLTNRERQVLALLGQWRTNMEIATSLSVDVRTAEFHVANVLAKLGLKSRGEVPGYLNRSSIENAKAGGAGLPAPLTSLVGREWELATLSGLLQRSRLVTVTGAGGIGKTRLAIEVARRLERPPGEGIWFVDLAPVANEDLVVSILLATLGLRGDPGRSAEETLMLGLSQSKALLLIDNCEHLLAGVGPLVQRILGTCPDTQILATSRVPLGVTGEVMLPLGGLGLSSDSGPEAALRADSVRLFLDRVQRVRPTYEPSVADLHEIAAVCRLVDGMPLAIELAAARLTGMTPAEMRHRIADGQTLLTTSSKAVPERHKTIDAAIDWSYSLLSEKAQATFRRLSVFAGFNVAAAEGICATPPVGCDEVQAILLELVDNSLVMANLTNVETRYRLLEPLRQYAQRRLVYMGEADDARRRHAEYFAVIAGEELPWGGTPRPNWMQAIEADEDNLRQALGWARTHDAVTIIHALHRLWSLRGHLAEINAAVEDVLSKTEDSSPDRQRMLALSSNVRMRMGDTIRAISLAIQALDLARHLGLRAEELTALNVLGNAQDASHQPADAVATYQAAVSLARTQGDPWRLGILLHNLGLSKTNCGQLAGAHAPLIEAQGIFGTLGDLEGEETVLHTLGVLAFAEGDDVGAANRWSEVVRIGRQLGDRYQVNSAIDGLAQLCIKHGDAKGGLRLGGAGASMRAATGMGVSTDHPQLDQWLARGRMALSKAAADQAWTEGMAMSFEEATRYALECIDQVRSKSQRRKGDRLRPSVARR